MIKLINNDRDDETDNHNCDNETDNCEYDDQTDNYDHCDKTVSFDPFHQADNYIHDQLVTMNMTIMLMIVTII